MRGLLRRDSRERLRPGRCVRWRHPAFAGAVAAAWLSMSALPAAGAARRAEERASALVARMTLDEKIALASSGAKGIPRLRIPALVVSDGPNGVGHAAANVTAFPNAEVVAAAWDRTVAHRFGAAVGAEAAGKGLNLLFAPTVNILRTSRWGRTAETFGEDPYLAGELVASEIRGMQ